MLEEANPLEAVDSKIAWNNPNRKALGTSLWLFTLFFWAVGFYVISAVVSASLSGNEEALADIVGALSPYVGIIGTALSMLVLFIAVAAVIMLVLMRKIARYVLYFLLGAVVVSSFGLAIYYLISAKEAVGAIILAIPGVILTLVILLKRERIRIAGRAMELSADAVLSERGTILAAFLSSILNLLTLIAGALTIFAIYGYLEAQLSQNSAVPDIIMIALIVILIWVTTFQTYFFDGVIASIVHAWYRSPHVDVASFKQGFRRAWEVQGAIAMYALVMSLLRVAAERAKRERGIAAAVLAAILRVAEDVVEFLTYYIIPAIVIRKTNFRDGLKESINKLRDLFIETLIGQFSFGYILAFFGAIYVVVLGFFGYMVGAYVLAGMVNMSGGIAGILTAVVYVLIGVFPLSLIFRSLSVAFKTILYEFGIDIEFAMRGEVLPNRLPIDVKKDFIAVLEEAGLSVPAELLLQ